MPLLALCYVLHELEHFAHFDEMIDAYTIGYKGELINFIVEDKNATLTMLKEKFSDYPQDELDGLTITAPTRWCNIRKSNTENKLRMTMEADTQQIFEQQKTLISSYIVQQ
jgi:phosphomannomutase